MMDNVCTKIDGDILKFTAAVAMLIDHIGAIICPHISVLRIIGRISFPIFVFFIAEGCCYTKNSRRYLLNLLVFAAVTQAVKIIFNDNDDLNILFTFAAGVAVVFVFKRFADILKTGNQKNIIIISLIFAAVILSVWILNRLFVFQYDFWGCMSPCVIYAANYIKSSRYTKMQLKFILLFTSLTAIYFRYGGLQIWAFAAVLLLMCCSGKKGDRVPKYFFYIFYPAHLAVLYLIKNFI